MNNNIVEIKNLKKSYEKGNITSLNGIDLEIKKGEFVSIIGPSGSGKSTLLNMIGALDIPDEGNISVSGINLINNKKLNDFRRDQIGFVFQLHNLIPNLSVVENIEIPMQSIKLSNKKRRERAFDLLNIVELVDKAHLKPTKLSGGERQRVAIARALANNPSIILADEPTGALDSKTSNKVLTQLLKLHKEENVTIIMVTHDMNVANLADRTIEVLDGKIINNSFNS
ncbi:ABC transporter ATP-binding protein [Methanobrevibacter sp. DSM 116169]|uniref:ABC transporter ATP-binding protein n=1 Tax=Methanobrevibacter sp. DSM 116169 TaxID=3242727 RepID=UPI0038FCFCB2